jgi:hypothetical protein
MSDVNRCERQRRRFSMTRLYSAENEKSSKLNGVILPPWGSLDLLERSEVVCVIVFFFHALEYSSWTFR